MKKTTLVCTLTLSLATILPVAAADTPPAPVNSTNAAVESVKIWPMPAELPSMPPGVNPAAYPWPKGIENLIRIKADQAKAKAIPSSIELVFDGDSITDGWRNQPIWNERYAKLHAFDFGVGADKTEHVLWRLSQGQMDGIHPRLIVLLIGTNNGNPPEQVAEGVAAIVAEYRKRCPDAVILLQGIFPRGNLPDNPARARIKTINGILSKMDDGKHVINIDFGDKFLSADGTLSAEIMPDFLHPNAKGYQIWADAIQPVIDKVFPKK